MLHRTAWAYGALLAPPSNGSRVHIVNEATYGPNVRRSPYCVSCYRDITAEENALLRHILERHAPHRLAEIAGLKVIGRCGCGTCPTVIFGTFCDQALPMGESDEIARYTGLNAEMNEIGLALIVRRGALSELVVWGMDGAVTSLPSRRSLIPDIDPQRETVEVKVQAALPRPIDWPVE